MYYLISFTECLDEGYTLVGDTCYRLYTSSTTWENANKMCQYVPGHNLAKLETLEKHNLLNAYLKEIR